MANIFKVLSERKLLNNYLEIGNIIQLRKYIEGHDEFVSSNMTKHGYKNMYKTIKEYLREHTIEQKVSNEVQNEKQDNEKRRAR